MYIVSHNEAAGQRETLKLQMYQRLLDCPTNNSLGVSGNAGQTEYTLGFILVRLTIERVL